MPTTVAFQLDSSERHDEESELVDDVRVRDDVALPIPHEAGPRALRNLGHLEEVHGAAREGRDEDDGRAAALEELDRGLLVGREVSARRDGPGLGRRSLQPAWRGPDSGVASLEKREDEPARDEPEEDRDEDRTAALRLGGEGR